MRIIVNDSQYNKILIEEKKNTPTFNNWVNYMGDILSTQIHQFNVKEDVNTHTNLSNKLRGKTFFKELPIENFIINLVENVYIDDIKITFNPYWSLLVETTDNFILKDIELDIELPNRKINGINEINIIKNQLHKEFIKINRWYNSTTLISEQVSPDGYIPYTWDSGTFGDSELWDDAAELNRFFNKVISKKIHITGGKEGVITVDDTFKLAEKILLNNASIASSTPIYLGFKEGGIEASYDKEEIKDDFSLRKTQFWEDLKNKGFHFQVFEEVVGNTDMEEYGELPLFPKIENIPIDAHKFLPIITVDGKDFSIAFVKQIPTDELASYEGDKEKLLDQGYGVYGYDTTDVKGWQLLYITLSMFTKISNEEGYINVDSNLLFTPISTGNYFRKGNNKLYDKKGHSGHDYVAVNKKLVWLKSGKVISAHFGGKKDKCGGTIAVKTADGRKMIFCHMSEIFVDKGEKINPGRILGVTGGAKDQKGAGHSTGAHLHTGMKVGIKSDDPHGYEGKDYKLLRDE